MAICDLSYVSDHDECNATKTCRCDVSSFFASTTALMFHVSRTDSIFLAIHARVCGLDTVRSCGGCSDHLERLLSTRCALFFTFLAGLMHTRYISL